MSLRNLQEIIIEYSQHLYEEGRFRALDSSIEYPYDGPAFAFRRDGDHLEFIDKTQELLTLPDGEEIVAPVDHRDFRKPKSNQVRAAFLKFRYWENKIHRNREDGHATHTDMLQRELEIITGKLLPLAIGMLKPVAESYSLYEIDPEGGQSYWSHPPCELTCRIGVLESGESVPAEIQVKIEEFNDLLREMEKHIEDIREQESRSGIRKKAPPQFTVVDSPNRELTGRAGNPGNSGALSGRPDQTPRPDFIKKRTKLREARSRNDPLAAERRNEVEAYIAEVLEKTGKRITRADIWKSAHYKTRAEFERWQRNDPKATRAANERFTRLLKEKPHLK